MRETLVLFAATVVVVALLSGWSVTSVAAARPLAPSDAWIVAAAMIRATPAFFAGRTPCPGERRTLCAATTFRLAAAAIGRPASSATFAVDDGSYRVPLPPFTTPAAREGRFITLATAEELREYLHGTLPRAGWTYVEQFGSMHAMRRDGFALSVQSTFYAGTRIGEIRIALRQR